MNNNVSSVVIECDGVDDQQVVAVNARKSKRLGRGAVTTGLTCECGIFAAMATEWSAHKVTFFEMDKIISPTTRHTSVYIKRYDNPKFHVIACRLKLPKQFAWA